MKRHYDDMVFELYKKAFLLLLIYVESVISKEVFEETGWRVQQLKFISGFLLPESILNDSITNIRSFPPIIKETSILNSLYSIFSNAP